MQGFFPNELSPSNAFPYDNGSKEQTIMMAEAHPKGREVVDEMEVIHIEIKEYTFCLLLQLIII